eukprot:m.146925 g.146925  ORF g.146925 m.146925 type:complete len:575 (-) comp17777_c0_seq14:401-2125(-)
MAVGSSKLKAPASAPTYIEFLTHFFKTVADFPTGKVMISVWGSYLVWLATRTGHRQQQKTERGVEKSKPKARGSNRAFSDILKILLPKLKSRHGIYLSGYVLSLITRVFVTVKLADVGGKNAGYFGTQQWDKMFRSQAIFGTWCMVGAACTAAMKYLEKRVALSVREILYDEMTKKYFDERLLSYYRIDVDDPAARMTSDLEAYSREVVHLLGYFLKPAIDVLHLTYVLGGRVGHRNIFFFLCYFWFSAKSLDRVKRTLPVSLKDFKYGGAMMGFSVLIPREYLASGSHRSVTAITAGFVSDSALLQALANAMKDLADSFIEVPRVAGLASRVHRVFHAITQLPKRSPWPRVRAADDTGGVLLRNVTVRIPTRVGDSDTQGTLLIDNLSAEIAPGAHTVVRGPNGAGKSSLFRTLSGLWSVDADDVAVPARVFFMPQDCYFPVGTLASQVTYPAADSPTDHATIEDLLRCVGLDDVLEMHTIHGSCDWHNVLSGGQKQRLAWARMFFARPTYGFIDEGTSAISAEVIEPLYETAKSRGITLISIAHQKALDAYHEQALDLVGGGDGEWHLGKVE